MARPASQVFPLENGDHLDAAEFLRRYEAMPPSTRAELVEGTVFMSSAVRADAHAEPHSRLAAWLHCYKGRTPGTSVLIDPTLHFSESSVVQPDLLLRVAPDRGGRCIAGTDGYLMGPPDMVLEIAASSAGRDLHSKKDLYQAQGVREYLVWRTLDAAIDWFVNTGDAFEPLAPDAEGCLHSSVFPSLALDAPALLAGDDNRVRIRLESGLEVGAHAEFVARLERARRPD